MNRDLGSLIHLGSATLLVDNDTECIRVDDLLRFAVLTAVNVPKVLHLLLLVRHDRLHARMPVSRTHLSVFVCELESLDQSNCLVDGPADSVIVDLHRPQLMRLVQNKEASQGGSEHAVIFVGDKHAVVKCHLFRNVGQERELQLAQATFIPGCLSPGQMSEV